MLWCVMKQTRYQKSRKRIYKACTRDKKTIFKFDRRKYGISPLWALSGVIAQMRLAQLMIETMRPKKLMMDYKPGGTVSKGQPIVVGETGKELVWLPMGPSIPVPDLANSKEGLFWPICDAYNYPIELLRTGNVDSHGDVIMPGAFGKPPTITIRKHYTAEETKEILDRIKNQPIPWSVGMTENPVKIIEEEIKPLKK